jgi:hypothetical protein
VTDVADLSSIRTQVHELQLRITAIGERYATTPDSQIAAELFAVERSLLAAVRSLERATRML